MKGFTHINQKISKLLQRDYAPIFSDSYIEQHAHICLRAFVYEVLYTSTTYELNGELSHIKIPPKMPTYV